MSLLELEATIRGLPGVLGCVIVADPAGDPCEVQAFTAAGADRSEIERAILDEADRRGMTASLRGVLVYELETEALVGGPDSLRQAELLAELEALDDEPAGGPRASRISDTGSIRPVVRRVVATLSETSDSEARVALADGQTEVIGQAVAEGSTNGLEVVAQATVDAVHKMIGDDTTFTLVGASTTEMIRRQMVLVLVRSDGSELVGAALVRGGPLADATVRATLDALNRRLTRRR
jgi:hypothetical protein